MISRALYTAGKRVELFGKDEAMLQSFNDRSAISPWAKRAVSEAVYTKIVGGMTDDSFVPAGYATRAQAVVMLKRFLQVVEFIN